MKQIDTYCFKNEIGEKYQPTRINHVGNEMVIPLWITRRNHSYTYMLAVSSDALHQLNEESCIQDTKLIVLIIQEMKMKLYSTTVAMFLLVSSAAAFAANVNGPNQGSTQAPAPGPTPQPMEQIMFGESDGQPEISGDGIQNSTQVDNPSDIGSENSAATDSPEPVPTVGDVGIQNAK